MRIYRMTATFGKLEHETMTLQPGLNVIEAPNEWGKTTWCAFLITMLYGLDTSRRTRKTALADKEKYAPWSGSPMAGRIDLEWKGRKITIERNTKGRTPLGVFRAYETDSGLAVTELTAANCGQVLLGVEESVYRQSGFIRQSDLPVTQDEALRRRLNALVTTGDESGDSDRLAAELRELKNKIRYNRSGLLPQAEEKRRELEERITELESLGQHGRSLKQRLGETKSWIQSLENHAAVLQYAAAEADARQVAQARDRRDRAEEAMTQLEQCCAGQPSRQEAARNLEQIQAFRQELEQYRMAEMGSDSQPLPPVPPEHFRGQSARQAEEMVGTDSQRYQLLKRTKPYLVFWIVAAACLVLGVLALLPPVQRVPSAILFAAALALFLPGLRIKAAWKREAEALAEKYGSEDAAQWLTQLEEYRSQQRAFEQTLEVYREARAGLDRRKQSLQKQKEVLFGGEKPEAVADRWQGICKQWDDYDAACRDFQQAQQHLQAMQSMAQTDIKRPVQADALAYSEEETRILLADAIAEQQRLQNRLGQCQGRMEALGDTAALQAQLQAEQVRIEKLEQMLAAVTLSLDTLTQARQELQRKFAPRISSRARELMGRMTGGRYDRLTLAQDLSLLAGASREDTLREVLWRSDGTVDQLYLALRLAVAEELLPDAPLVLDDALIRFDDVRMKAAMEIFKEEARHRQVIVFTCQHREKDVLR